MLKGLGAAVFGVEEGTAAGDGALALGDEARCEECWRCVRAQVRAREVDVRHQVAASALVTKEPG